MGGCTFWTHADGKTAEAAFDSAVKEARYQHRHGGYSGTIAEKTSFTVVEVPMGREPRDFAQEILDNDDKRVSDKWGPAGCVKLTEGKWLFFGWASS